MTKNPTYPEDDVDIPTITFEAIKSITKPKGEETKNDRTKAK